MDFNPVKSAREQVDRLLTQNKNREWLVMPEWLKDEIKEHVFNGMAETRTTLTEALKNDFKATVVMAGDDVKPVLRELAIVLHNYLPSDSQGSVDRYQRWCAQGGLIGDITKKWLYAKFVHDDEIMAAARGDSLFLWNKLGEWYGHRRRGMGHGEYDTKLADSAFTEAEIAVARKFLLIQLSSDGR